MEGVGFIAELMPKHPIYTALLPDAARAAIGKPHRESVKAMAMLLAEDFRYDGHVDVFDGGPQISIARDKIRTVMDSRPARVGRCGPERPAVPLLLSNASGSFRVVETEASVEEAHAILSPDAARLDANRRHGARFGQWHERLPDGTERRTCAQASFRSTSSSAPVWAAPAAATVWRRSALSSRPTAFAPSIRTGGDRHDPATGDCSLAANRMAARLRTAGYPDSDPISRPAELP